MAISGMPAPSALAEFCSGWGILLAGTIGTAISGSHFHVTGAMINPLHAAYGWTPGQIAFALTIAAIITPIVNAPVGILIDRYGPGASLCLVSSLPV